MTVTNVHSIRPNPRFDCPSVKLVRDGAEALTSAELLALHLPHLPAREAVRIAQYALDEAGDLRCLLDLPPDEMTRLPGIRDRDATALIAALEIGRRHIATSVTHGEAIQNPKDLVRFFTAHLRHHRIEHFLVLFLDTRHRVLALEEVSRGTLDGTVVYEREVVRRALHHHAGAVVLCHNHPSGVVSPSETDKKLTRELTAALALVRVRVLDHLIIGEQAAFSFVEHGLL